MQNVQCSLPTPECGTVFQYHPQELSLSLLLSFLILLSLSSLRHNTSRVILNTTNCNPQTTKDSLEKSRMSAFSLSFIACCLLLSTLSTPTSAVIEEHRVHSLPGATSPLESPWFSGSIYSGTKPGTNVKLYYHYTLILSHSSNPFNDPLLLWTNGGKSEVDSVAKR